MLVKYLERAMCRAHYEVLAEDVTFYGEIPEFQRVFASAPTLEQTRNELAEVLEEWLFLRIARQLPIPTVDGIMLSIEEVD
jgi:predicted RNase H-like HicB family nuclease